MFDSETYKSNNSPLIEILKVDAGYFELKKLCEILLIIPVTTTW